MTDLVSKSKSPKHIGGIILIIVNLIILTSFYVTHDFSMDILSKFNDLIKLNHLVDWIAENLISMNVGEDNVITAIKLKTIFVMDIIILVIINAIILLIMRQKRGYRLANIILCVGLITLVIFINTDSVSYRGIESNAKVLRQSESEKIRVKDKAATVSIADISIDIPAFFVDESMTLTLDVFDDSDDDVIYDLKLLNKRDKELHMLGDYIEINLPLDDIDVRSRDLDMLEYTYYDTETKEWKAVAWYYNMDTDNVVLLTNHFTEFRQRILEPNDGELMKVLPKPVFQYSKERGIHIKGSNATSFDIKALEVEKSLMDSALDGLNTVVDNDNFYRDLALLKLLSTADKESVYNDYDAIKSGLELVSPKSAKVSGMQKYIYGAEKVPKYPKISNSLKYFSIGFGVVDFSINSFAIYDSFAQGTFEGNTEGIYRTGRQMVSVLAPTFLGPYGFFVDPAIFMAETAAKEIEFEQDEKTKDAYYQFYTSKEYSKPVQYWYARFDEIMEIEVFNPYDINEAIQLLNTEMDEYLHEFWLPENEEILEEIGVGYFNLSSDEKKNLVHTYKKDAKIYEVQESIVHRYIERLEKSAIELQILLAGEYYERMLNNIVEFEVYLEGYDTRNSKVNVYVDGKEIWEGSFNRRGHSEFQSRYYQLLPSDLDKVQHIEVVTTLIDDNGNEELVREEWMYLNMDKKLTYEYTNENVPEEEVTYEEQPIEENPIEELPIEEENPIEENQDSNEEQNNPSNSEDDVITIDIDSQERITAIETLIYQILSGSKPLEDGFEINTERLNSSSAGENVKYTGFINYGRDLTHDGYSSYQVFGVEIFYDEYVYPSIAELTYTYIIDQHKARAESDEYTEAEVFTIGNYEAFYAVTSGNPSSDDRVFMFCNYDKGYIIVEIRRDVPATDIFNDDISLMTIEHTEGLMNQMINGLDAIK